MLSESGYEPVPGAWVWVTGGTTFRSFFVRVGKGVIRCVTRLRLSDKDCNEEESTIIVAGCEDTPPSVRNKPVSLFDDRPSGANGIWQHSFLLAGEDDAEAECESEFW